MFIDINNLSNNSVITTDICIVGAGAAGIAIAKEFQDTNLSISLVESGGLVQEKNTEELNYGENVGEHSISFYQRKRFFGGGTNCWGGNCAPFDDIDFEDRDYVPFAKWPISFAEIQKYYPRTQELCGLDNPNYDSSYWQNVELLYKKQHIELSNQYFDTKVFQNKALRFGKEYKNIFKKKNSNIDVYLNATITNLELNNSGKVIDCIHASSLENKNIKIKSKYFILAAGIENARLLLQSDNVNKKGIGNEHDTVGRYFMAHILMFTGFLIENPPYKNLDLYKLTILGNEKQRVLSTFHLKENIQREYCLLNYAAHISKLNLLKNWQDHIIFQGEIIANEFSKLQKKIFYSSEATKNNCFLDSVNNIPSKASIYALGAWSEQAPSPDNRILLSSEKDRLGVRKILMKWKLNQIDKYTVAKGQELLNKEFIRSGVGKVIPNIPDYKEKWPRDIVRAAHYMGGTRMSNNPKEGVVDKNCKVHGIENLFIAGGSVMPTSGATMVTYNLLALAIRLADHLKLMISIKNN